jgi:S-DNA-T family DNA segregation ATPase FtsK/SpoIIIE
MAAEIEKKQTDSKTYSGSSEIIAVVLLALAVLVFLCLVTYSPNDWSLNTASTQETHNWVGVVGSVIADLLFQTIGLTAYFLPALLVLIAWRFYRFKDLPISISRIVGYLLFVISVSSLAALFGFYGGIIGAFFQRNLTWLLGNIGAAILLLAIFASSVLLITSLSLDSFLGNFRLAWENFRVHFDEWLNKRRNAKALRLKF